MSRRSPQRSVAETQPQLQAAQAPQGQVHEDAQRCLSHEQTHLHRREEEPGWALPGAPAQACGDQPRNSFPLHSSLEAPGGPQSSMGDWGPVRPSPQGQQSPLLSLLGRCSKRQEMAAGAARLPQLAPCPGACSGPEDTSSHSSQREPGHLRGFYTLLPGPLASAWQSRG